MDTLHTLTFEQFTALTNAAAVLKGTAEGLADQRPVASRNMIIAADKALDAARAAVITVVTDEVAA